jgi:hypothetical protein
MRSIDYLFLATFGPLFGDHAYSFVTQHAYTEHGDATSVYEFHRFHSQYGSNYVVRVMFVTTDRHQTVARSAQQKKAHK